MLAFVEGAKVCRTFEMPTVSWTKKQRLRWRRGVGRNQSSFVMILFPCPVDLERLTAKWALIQQAMAQLPPPMVLFHGFHLGSDASCSKPESQDSLARE